MSLVLCTAKVVCLDRFAPTACVSEHVHDATVMTQNIFPGILRVKPLTISPISNYFLPRPNARFPGSDERWSGSGQEYVSMPRAVSAGFNNTGQHKICCFTFDKCFRLI